MTSHRVASRLVAIVPLLTALALLTPGGASARVPVEFFGVNAQGLFPYLPQAAWPRHLNRISASGIRAVRYDASWDAIEPYGPVEGRRSFRWAHYDRVVGSLARAGLRWYPVLDYSARWATSRPPNLKAPPIVDQDFAVFARAVAWRYGRNGTFWRENPELPAVPVTTYEIWNEQNGGYFWQPGPEPARYAGLYLQARAAIRIQDPAARVIVGGLIPRGAGDFVAGMLTARPDLAGQIDAIAYHPYAETPQRSVAYVNALRQRLTDIGLGHVPIEINEIGWTTRGAGSIPDAVRAANMRWLARWAATCGCVSRFTPHTWVSRELWENQREDWFGLYHPDGTPTQAGVAYTDAVREATLVPAPRVVGRSPGRRPRTRRR